MRAIGRRLEAHAERLGDGGRNHCACLLGIELQGAADEMAGVEETEDQVGVGDRRALSPPVS